MSPKWSNLSSQDVIRVLVRKGFQRTRQEGSHAFYYHADKRFAVVPIHKGRNLSRGVIKKIMQTAGLTEDDFR
jgi:predicted RNA binding protein YcfA (HicA-like mRNA interferase family)